MTQLHTLGLVATVLFLAGIAIYTGTLNRKKEQGTSAGIVSGVILGTIIGGSSTIGTAQLAYVYGLSAWGYTVGASIGCLLLALVYAKPIRASGCKTLVGIIGKEYGTKTGLTVSLLQTVAMFINLLSQILAAGSVAAIVFPEWPVFLTVIAAVVCMILYVVFGGTKGAGIVGLFKIALLGVSMLVCGVLAFRLMGGASEVVALMHRFSGDTGVNYFSFFSRGFASDFGNIISVVLGILTTQTYAQAIFSAKSDRVARRGGVISAFLIPIFGLLGILVGLYMRSVTDPSVFVPKAALTTFAIEKLPPLFGGVVLGSLFIASVGTGAGIALGVATVLQHDLIGRFTKRFDTPKGALWLSRGLIVAILSIAAILSLSSLGDFILDFTYLSMGLRAAVVFVPLGCALWMTGKIPASYIFVSVLLGTAAVVFGKMIHLPVEPLFVGVAVSMLTAAVGYLSRRKA